MRVWSVAAVSISVILIGILLLAMYPAFASGVSYTVSGTVIDVHGNPVKGANVSLLAAIPTSGTLQVINTTQTNDTGYYNFVGEQSNYTTIKVIVAYTDGNKTYQVPDYFSIWYPASGIQVVPSSETQFPNYPPATNGYVTGSLYSNGTPFGEAINGEVHLTSIDGNNQYSVNVNTSNGSRFTFYVPGGNYKIYATQDINELQYTSQAQNITVVPSWTTDFVSYNNTSGVTYSVPWTLIYLEPYTSQLIQPTPTTTHTLNTNVSAISSSGLPVIPVKSAAEATAGGVAVVSCAYVLIKFFGLGAITRTSGRLDNNSNRKKMQQYIVDNPGLTLHELSHSLGMNIGTVRYHLLILGLNHRIISAKFDDKFVRYFPNSGSYTKNEQLIISVVRRDGIRKVISLLLDQPGLTNADISSKLNMQASATSRYTKELFEKGIITKTQQGNGMLGYSINNDRREIIADIIERTVTNSR